MNQMGNGVIQMAGLRVKGHRHVAERALKYSKCHGHRDHPWGDDWSPAADFYRQALRYEVSDVRGGPVYPGWEADDWTFACFFQGVALRGWDLWNDRHSYGPGTADHFKWTVAVGEGFFAQSVGDLIYGGYRGAEVIMTAVRKCIAVPGTWDADVWQRETPDVAHAIHLAEGQPMGCTGRDWDEAQMWLGICLRAKQLYAASRSAAVPAAGPGATAPTAVAEIDIDYGKMPVEQHFLDTMATVFFQQPGWSLPLLRRRACRT